MGTYPLKQIMADYENGTLTPEMVSGHTLQHLDKLYEAQAAANISLCMSYAARSIPWKAGWLCCKLRWTA